MHHRFHIEGLTDLSKIREEARRATIDDRHPEDSIIHFHAYTDNLDCKEEPRGGFAEDWYRDHEVYTVPRNEP